MLWPYPLAAVLRGSRSNGSLRRRVDGVANVAPPASDGSESLRLATAIQRIAASLQERELLQAICIGSRNVVGAQGAALVFVDDGEVLYAEEDAIAPLWKGRRFPVASCLSGRAITNGEVVLIPDIYIHPDVPLEYYRQTFVRSLALIPVDGFGLPGALGLYWSSPHVLRQHDVGLLQSIANAAAIGMANARLHRQVCDARTEAERANMLKDQTIGLIAHELRNPTQGLIGWAQRLRVAAGDPATTSRALAAIIRCAEDQQRLIEDLLDATRLSAGTLRLERRPLNVADLVRTALECAGPNCQHRDLRLAGRVLDDPVEVVGDPLRLRQVIDNVLSNACKFTPPGGAIDVVLRRDGRWAEILVADTGRGIPAASLPHVFKRFYQVGPDARRDGGLGLGLAIVRSIIELHEGEVEVRSPGAEQGTTVRIALPASRSG